MIDLTLKNYKKNFWYVVLPYEINNSFLLNAGKAAKDGKIKGVSYIPSFNDFGAPIEFEVNELDKLYKDFQTLEENLDEITKNVPLPKTIGDFDGFYRKGFISFYDGGIKEVKKDFPLFNDKTIEEMINYGNIIYNIKKFTKEDMLLIISLIKKKILEAKEKGEILVFSGD